MNDRPKREQAIALKRSWHTYAQIAEIMGVTRQRAQHLVRPNPLVYAIVVNRADGMCQSCFQLIDRGQVHHRLIDSIEFNHPDNLLWVCAVCHPKLDAEIDYQRF